LRPWTPGVFFYLFLAAFFGAWTSFTGYAVIGRLSALAHQILGQLKMAVLVLASKFMLGADLNAVQLAGAAVTVVAVVAYTRQTVDQRRRHSTLLENDGDDDNNCIERGDKSHHRDNGTLLVPGGGAAAAARKDSAAATKPFSIPPFRSNLNGDNTTPAGGTTTTTPSGQSPIRVRRKNSRQFSEPDARLVAGLNDDSADEPHPHGGGGGGLAKPTLKAGKSDKKKAACLLHRLSSCHVRASF